MKKERNGDELIIFAEGRIDTNRSQAFAKEVEGALDGVKTLIFDFAEVRYISSSGLRVLMKSLKAMRACGGEMRVINVNEDIYDIFEATGFLGICEIESK